MAAGRARKNGSKSRASASHATGLRRVAIAVLIIAVLGGVFYAGTALQRALDAGSAQQAAGSLQQVTLVRVVDGDTIVVNVDGTDTKVRFIGVDAPESVASDESRNTPEGTQASDYLKSLVRTGQTLYLEKDVSDTDKYGRLLRYVWTEEPRSTDAKSEIAEKMLGGIMVAQGYAKAKVYEPDKAHADAFEALMKEAVAAGRGVSYLWNE